MWEFEPLFYRDRFCGKFARDRNFEKTRIWGVCLETTAFLMAEAADKEKNNSGQN